MGTMPDSIERVSVVIPCLNDSEALKLCLLRLNEAEMSVSFELEVIVADASTDNACRNVAEECGALLIHCETRGRGQQLNAGARAASGQLLIFNHADTQLSAPHIDAAVNAIESAGAIGGAYFRDLAWQYPRLRWAGALVRAFTRRYGILYGDQSLFATRTAFDSLGGFADVPIMEDVDFSARMKKHGRICLVDPPLRTSMRRFKRRGYLRNKLQNIVVVWLWRLNVVTPEQIYRWYYRATAS
ncbi:MAG: rSAM/selenodomain-associated transferase 2 [Verrucomicrobiales bacterium]